METPMPDEMTTVSVRLCRVTKDYAQEAMNAIEETSSVG
jgi:hypothetical protein